jgi:selenocysteine-specific elongation factor
MQSHGKDVELSVPGTRTALNLADVDPGVGVHRGDVITLPDLGSSNDCLDVRLDISARATRSMKDGVRVRVHYGSGNVPAHVALAGEKELPVGERRLAQLRLEAPVFLCAGDHLTIRDWSEQQTLAGAVVLDPDASRRSFRTESRQQWLRRLAESFDTESVAMTAAFIAAYVARDRSVRPSRAFLKTRFSQSEIGTAIQQLVREGCVIAVGDILVEPATWSAALQHSVQLIDEAHREHPERPGLPLTELRSAVTKAFPLDHVFDALVATLSDQGFMRSGAAIHRASHRAALPEPLRAAGETLRRALSAQPLEPPSRKELTPDAASQRALKFLIESGEVVEISADLVLSASAAAQATTQVKAFVTRHGPATVSEIRQVLGTSRRVVVPLLEYLDRTFVTVRRGDRRILRS